MAPKKKRSERSPKNKERKEPGFKTIGFRSSEAFAAWLDEVAKVDRVTIAVYLEKAAIQRAESLGITKKPPERIP